MVRLTQKHLDTWGLSIKGTAIGKHLRKPSVMKKFDFKIEGRVFLIEEEREEELKQYIQDNFSKKQRYCISAHIHNP